jgi:hypothetical protein
MPNQPMAVMAAATELKMLELRRRDCALENQTTF